jgi:hypothetical protein
MEKKQGAAGTRRAVWMVMAGVLVVAGGILWFAAPEGFPLKFFPHPRADRVSPIIIGDGSIVLHTGPLLPWTNWEGLPSNTAPANRFAWTTRMAPKSKGRLANYKLDPASGDFCASSSACGNNVDCSFMVTYTNGEFVWLRASRAHGKRLVVVSSSPYGDFVLENNNLTLRKSANSMIASVFLIEEQANGTIQGMQRICQGTNCKLGSCYEYDQ